MRFLDKIGQLIINFLIVLVTVITLFIIYSYINLEFFNKDFVSIFGYTYFEVVSGSMEPVIKKHDLVIVKLNCEYGEEDIVTYKLENDFITHRVKKINIMTVVTKGDANNTLDKAIAKESVIGKVVLIVPKFGVWKEVLLTPKVFVLLILTLILFSFTFSYNTKAKRKKLIKQKERRQGPLSKSDLPIVDRLNKDVSD